MSTYAIWGRSFWELEMLELELYKDKLMEVIEPLSHISLHYFTFSKKYESGKMLRLSTHPNWINTYCCRGFDKIGAIEKPYYYYRSGTILWNELAQFPIYEMAKKEFGFYNGIIIIRRYEKNCEFYEFAMNASYGARNGYTYETSEIEQHTYYIREKLHNVIAKLSRDNGEVHDDYEELNNYLCNIKKRFDHDRLHYIRPNHYYVDLKGKTIELTVREVDVINYLKIGKTTSEISMILGLSERTCEDYLKKIKQKFKCESLLILGNIIQSIDPNDWVY